MYFERINKPSDLNRMQRNVIFFLLCCILIKRVSKFGSPKNVILMYLYIPVREIIKTNSPIFKYV